MAMAAGCSGSSGASSTDPALALNGSTTVSSFHDGQTITVAMGPNKVFKPLIRVDILMCNDPGGKASALPKSFSACDEDTIQGDSVIPKADGSFKEKAYMIFRLPSRALGETTYWPTRCDSTHQCVLFVGEDQNNFSLPKVFSHPFVVTGGTKDTVP
jgi:hypothetical protein